MARNRQGSQKWGLKINLETYDTNNISFSMNHKLSPRKYDLSKCVIIFIENHVPDYINIFVSYCTTEMKRFLRRC